MAQIIDMEERRKPRSVARAQALPGVAPNLLDPASYVETLFLPLAQVWRSWMVSWGSLWLAPLGLQVIDAEPPPAAPQDRAGPRR